MSDVREYLQRSRRVAALRLEQAGAGKPLAEWEEAAWQWIEDRYPDVLMHRDRMTTHQLRDVIIQAVAAVQVAPSARRALIARLEGQLMGAGPLEPYMADPAVTEIMVTGTKVRIERDGRYETMPPLASRFEAAKLAEFLCSRARSRYQPTLPLQTIMWEANGARINIAHESVTGNDGPIITIRKRNQGAELDLPDLVDRGMLSEDLADWLLPLIRGGANVVMAGPTGTGKTTVLRALSRAAIPPRERLVTIEDIDELRLVDYFEDCASLIGHEKSDPESVEPDVSIHALFLNALRMRPDRIILGEVRGPEAKDVLEAGVSEIGGVMYTVHLRDPNLLIQRFYWMLINSGLPTAVDVVREMVTSSIDLVIQIDRPYDPDRDQLIRVISAVSEVRPDAIVPIWEWTGESWAKVAPLSERLQRKLRLRLGHKAVVA